MKFNRENYKVMHLDSKQPRQQEMLGIIHLESCPVEKVLVDNDVTISQQCAFVAKKANAWSALGKILPSGVILLLYLALARLCPVLHHSVQQRYGHARNSPVETCQDDQGTGSSLLCR